MWQVSVTPLEAGQIQQIHLHRDDRLLCFSEVLEALEHNQAFRSFFNETLANVPFSAYFWECPALTTVTLKQPFEAVLVEAETLAMAAADVEAFAEYFAAAAPGTQVVQFPNLGKDAWLVVPCPLQDSKEYTHLARFVRSAPATQQQAYWQTLAQCVRKRLSPAPLWLSSSGLGVYWLHLRLDTFPKYYTYRPYTRMPE